MSVDSTPVMDVKQPVGRRSAADAGSGEDIKRRTPEEQAIAEQTDRRPRYERRMREQGFHKTSFWVRADCVEEVKALVKILNASGGLYRKDLVKLLDDWTRR